MRYRIFTYHYVRLIGTSMLTGLVCAVLAASLKHLTEHFEHLLFGHTQSINPLLFIVMPSVGITMIYFLRKYLFQNRKNKGITEIYKTLDQRKNHLPLFKIPSHYVNGFLTVVSGGSTGIEVSTVVAAATAGNAAYKEEMTAYAFKREMICAGVAAGVTVLFGSPLAGWLFAMEVIARGISRSLVVSCTAAALVAGVFVYFFDNHPLLPFTIGSWRWEAVPFFFLLSLMGSTLAAYFTVLVIRIKGVFSKIQSNFVRVNLGALVVGTLIFFLPYLFGDSYRGLNEILRQAQGASMGMQFAGILLFLILLKPLAASLTLGAGGDGGVFAPSIVAGAFLGIFFALFCNRFLGTDLIVINFALVGAAATLSAAIHAPLTALFLICNLAPNGFNLFFPVLMASFVARLFVTRLLPYNVYTYDLQPKE